MGKIKILVADDHSVVREGLRALFSRAPEFTVVAEASDGEELLARVGEYRPDIAIIDISMPKLSGAEAVRRLKEAYPGTGILILTIHDNEEYVCQMLMAGAQGYVLKDAGKQELFNAVKAVNAGQRFLSPGISRLIIDEFVKRSLDTRPPSHDLSGGSLTSRETEILGYIAGGMTNAEIAEKLFLSIRTVNSHRTNMMQKLNIHNTARLVRYAVENGIVKPQT